MSFATSHSAGASPSETVRVCDSFKVCFGDDEDDDNDNDDDDGQHGDNVCDDED